MRAEGSIPARFREVARRFPDRTALTAAGRSWTYQALERRVVEIAHAISQASPTGNDCVAVLAEHSPEMVVATLAVLFAGKAALGIHPELPEAAARVIVRDARSALLLATAACVERAHAIAVGTCPVVVLDTVRENPATDREAITVGPDALATIVYTSGTTGAPKGVSKSHRAILHRVELAAEHDAITHSDRQSLLTHISFAAAEVDVFGALLSGATLCVFDLASHGFLALGDWIEQEQITVLHPPVLLFRRFLASLQGDDLFPSVRLIALAGDTVLPSDIGLWQRRFARTSMLTQRFSATETGLLTVKCFNHDDDVDAPFALAGWPVAGKILTLVDDQGAAVAPGEAGALMVQSRYLATGYWHQPNETQARFKAAADGSGETTYATGDYGRWLPDGRFVFLGRRDQQVKIRGYRVDAREVEARLTSLASVSEAAVVPYTVGDERRLMAFVVPASGQPMNVLALGQTLATLLPPWKVPARFSEISSLPTTLTGKLDRQRLEELARDRGSATPPPPPSLALEDQLGALWCAAIGVAQVGPDDDFAAAGGDSISAMTILVEIERRYGVRLRPGDLLRGTCIRQLALLIKNTTEVRRLDHANTDDLPAGPAPVVLIQSQGGKPPFFLVHGWGGGVLPLLELARALGPEQPTYGLQTLRSHGSWDQPSSLEPSSLEPSSLQAVAREHATRIRALDPHGPYYLGGYSLGGMIAYEIARQLVAAGKVVGLLALLDATPSNLPWRLFLKVHFRHWLARATYHGRELLMGNVGHRVSYLGGRIETLTRIARGKQPHKQAESDPFAVAVARYRPGRFAGPAVLFVADSQKKDLVSAWRHLVSSKLEVERVRGSHDTLLDSAHLPELAAALRNHLDRAHGSHERQGSPDATIRRLPHRQPPVNRSMRRL